MLQSTSIALTIAGSDSGGGAGVQADLKTFSALGVYGASVITAVTAQNTRAVTFVHDIPVNVVVAQLRAVLDDLAIGAIKIGMLFSPEIIIAVSQELENQKIPIILDPVMIAKSGDALLRPDAVTVMVSEMLTCTDILTPNLPEAAFLLGTSEAKTTLAMEEQAHALLDLGPKSVFMKGGHGTGATCVDLLVEKGQPAIKFEVPRLRTKNTHGTGCTLSSAIAAGLAKNLPLKNAVQEAHDYLQHALCAADTLSIGSGHGPVHHFYNLWGTK